MDANQVRSDFDRIARLGAPNSDDNQRYYDHLLAAVPARCAEALDVGCGLGSFTRALAARARHVTGIDLSPEMLRGARERSAALSNISYVEADVLTWPLAEDRYDVIASLNTLHHLPAAETLGRFARALRPGGTLLILDVRNSGTPAEWVMSALAHATSIGTNLIEGRRLVPRPEVRAAWREHGSRETYLTFDEARRLGAALPGALVTRHLKWRYSIIWTKPR